MASERSERRLNAEAQVRRMAILGELLAHMNHEINNLMMGVLGYTELELGRAKDPTSAHNLTRAFECAKNVRDLTRNLLRLTRLPASEAAGDLWDALASVRGIYERRVTSQKVEVIEELCSPLPAVALPTGDLRLVLANLFKNAIDAVEGEPAPVIRFSAERREANLSIEVWNSGPPIPSTHLPEIFTPFFTTKPDASGTGLGLSMCQRLVSQAGGTLSARNPEEGGVLFTLELPLAAAVPETAAPRRKDDSGTLRGRRVLVVDDENTAREVLKLMVSQMGGARVDACASGEEALKILGIEDFDAVVLDLRMAGLSGQDVYRCLPTDLKRRVVFVTGDVLRPATKTFIDQTHQPILLKPIAYRELLAAVQKVAV